MMIKSSIKDIMTEVVNKTPSLFYTNPQLFIRVQYIKWKNSEYTAWVRIRIQKIQAEM